MKRPSAMRLVAVALATAGCSSEPEPAREAAVVGVNVAALNLQGVGDVVWDLEVRNGASPSQVVWQRRVSSSGYGDGAGSASYVGPCDAGANPNTVRVWVVGVYEAPVSVLGTFSSGGVGATTGTAVAFQNPTATGPLSRDVVCSENTDVAVQFDVALMRPAQQGFFDIAVNFNNIFCSAKFDCCADGDGTPGCAASGAEDLKLLFDAAGSRASTMVLAFACTAGPTAGVETQLYLDDLVLDCSSPPASFAADLTIDPSGVAGNQCVAGADGMSGCDDVVTEGSGVDADTYLYQIGVYRGVEQLTSGGAAAQKVYWNVALGVKRPAITGCWLRTQGTADDALDTAGVHNGVIPAGAVYPFVQWDVNLATCTAQELEFGDAAAMVRPEYTTTGGAARGFQYGFGPSMPAGAFCGEPCQNGGTCVNGTCQCPSSHTGAHCETPAATSACAVLRLAGTTTSGYYNVDPDGAGPSGLVNVWCDMTAAGGGWTRVFLGANNEYSTSLGYIAGTLPVVAASTEMMYAYTDVATGAVAQAWRFPRPSEFTSISPLAGVQCGYVTIDATRLSDGHTTTQILRYGWGSFGSTCDDGCSSTWGQTCLKNNSTPGSAGGYLDFPHYASYAWSGSDHCSSSNQSYTAVGCSDSRRFAILVR